MAPALRAVPHPHFPSTMTAPTLVATERVPVIITYTLPVDCGVNVNVDPMPAWTNVVETVPAGVSGPKIFRRGYAPALVMSVSRAAELADCGAPTF